MEAKVILIVGGSGGIGSACGKKFADEGAKVVLAGRDRSKAEETAKEINEDKGEAFVIGVAKSVFYAANQPGDSVFNEVTIQPESHQMV